MLGLSFAEREIVKHSKIKLIEKLFIILSSPGCRGWTYMFYESFLCIAEFCGGC